MSDEGKHDQHDDHDHAHGGTGKYWAVFFALCLLTTCSFLTYFPFWDKYFSEHVGWAFMMAVSCTKAMLVICFFMHLIWEANWKYVLTIPAAMMSLFLTFMLVPDVGCRMNWYSEERWKHAAELTDDSHDTHGSHDDHHDDG